jgi:hypothetical protein
MTSEDRTEFQNLILDFVLTPLRDDAKNNYEELKQLICKKVDKEIFDKHENSEHPHEKAESAQKSNKYSILSLGIGVGGIFSGILIAGFQWWQSMGHKTP